MKQKKVYLFVFFVFILSHLQLFSETVRLDSLWRIYHSEVIDTVRINAILDLSDHYYLQNPDTVINLCLEAEKLSETGNYQFGLSESYGWLGYLYMQKGIGAKALNYFIKSLKVREEMNDKNGMANALNNIAYIYDNQREYDRALKHYEKALSIREELGNKEGMANILNNIAYIYDMQGDLNMGLNFYMQSLTLREEITDLRGMAESYNNIGTIYRTQKEYDKALEYYNKSLETGKKINDLRNQTIVLTSIAFILNIQGRFKEAEVFCRESLKIAQQLGYPALIISSSGELTSILKKLGKYEQALEYFELFVITRDSIRSEKNQKDLIRTQTKYEFEKAQIIEEQRLKEERQKISDETQRRDNLQYSIILIGILTLFVLVLFALPKVSPLWGDGRGAYIAEGLIFFAFLIFFEFLLVLADPYVDDWTGGAPGWKLLINAGIAALIFPVHAFFERLLKKRMTTP